MRFNQVSPSIDDQDIKAVNDYLKSGGWITEHKVTKELEEKIKNFTDRKFCITVPNGTIAIYLSLLAAGISNGKRVAIPNLTMVATVNAAIWANAIPVLVDVDENLCMSYEDLIRIKNLDAVLYVPLNGRAGDGLKINNWCKENNIKFIEDSAHALGSEYSPKIKCGGLGDLSILSFTPHKIITMGQGGMILTNMSKNYKFLNDLKTFNRKIDKVDWYKGFGLNFKITDLQASLGLSQFNKLEKFISNKKTILETYKENINNDNLEVLNFQDNEVPWFFDIKTKTMKYRNLLAKELRKKGVETREFYPALSLQDHLKKYRNNNLKFSENVFKKLLWLPSSNSLTRNDVKEISSIINSIV